MVEVEGNNPFLPNPRILSPCNSGRRRSNELNSSNSPEFEFWVTRNPSNLPSADELFSGGVILPLQNLHLANDSVTDRVTVSSVTDPPTPENPPESSGSGHVQTPQTESAHISSGPALTSSKRWTDIFKKTETVEKGKNVKDKKREKKHGGSTTASAAELNINIWPFSRSRSAGNGGTRPRTSTARKVSSAPCSRSNSGGEAKTRKWPNSPNRTAGVHLGRTSPVWQARKITSGKKNTGGSKSARVLSLNVPMCIGYRQQLSCRSDENSAMSIAAAAATGGENGGGVAGERGSSNFFNIKGLFSKKVY